MERSRHIPYIDVKGKNLNLRLVELGLKEVSSYKIVGFCHFRYHRGFLTKHILIKHKCVNKHCPSLEKFKDYPYWKKLERKRQKDNLHLSEEKKQKKFNNMLEAAIEKASLDESADSLNDVKLEVQLACLKMGYNIMITKVLPFRFGDIDCYIVNYASKNKCDDKDRYFKLEVRLKQTLEKSVYLKHIKLPDGKFATIDEWNTLNGGNTMDITPIYELKSRLRAAAIAGTSLLSEDFRLKKAAEGFAPLAGSSPVFAKINEMTGKLLESGKPEDLLDTITLVDAVITTLATVGTSEKIETIKIEGNSTAIVNAPYSQLSPLLDALTTSGSGNYNTFLTIRDNFPELMNDYRVKPALVKGLNASYSELALEVEKTLCGMGKDVVPLLKKDFDPKGKKDMLRRVNVIESIAGADENDFYLEQLENAEKDVRKALIYALRHDEGNIDRLIELTKTEKGKPKDAAFFALAGFSDEKAAAPFRELGKKKPDKAVEYLRDVTGEWQSELTAELINRLLVGEDGKELAINEALAPTKKSQFGMLNQMCAITGKTGSAIEEIYRKIKPAFEKDIKPCARWLGNTILKTNDEGMRKLAVELNSNPKMKNAFQYAEAIVRLTGAEDCSKWLEKEIKKDRDGMLIIRKSAFSCDLAEVLEIIAFRNGKYELVLRTFDEMTDKWSDNNALEVTADVKGMLSDIIMKALNNGLTAKLLTNWIDRSDAAYCDKLADYFQKACCNSGSGWAYPMQGLEKCGRRNIKGLALGFIKNNSTAESYVITGFFARMPGDKEYKLSEGREIVELMRKGKLKCKLNPDSFSDYLDKSYG